MYFRMTPEGRRDRWMVKVNADVLVARCEERMAFHRGRIAFWEREHTSAEQVLRSEGIRLKHFDVTGGRRTEAQLDTTLAQRVSECERRIKENRDSLARFGAFRALLVVAGPDAMMELSADDVLYFNLEGADIGGEDEEAGS